MKPQYSAKSSFGYAFTGIATAWKKGHNIRIQTVAGVVAVVLGAAFQISVPEWCAVIICIGAVIGGETFNTALEDVVDLASPDIHPLAKSAKDMAAGAVLIMALASFVVGVVVFLPRILNLLGV